ncbi:YciI family protein [Edaphobacter albus]|uniref:YciI family protein n=1 Tax=Edaphobacter sp. 4G125 TaxID=2763071 RepID=UPI0021032BE4|nr:YciI family protein [Edaphobacter sp. 4G125]
MNPQERDLMQQHVVHIRSYFESGSVLAFGPVLAPEGSFGMAILNVPDLSAAQNILETDPSVVAGLNRFEIYPMHLGGAQGARESS